MKNTITFNTFLFQDVTCKEFFDIVGTSTEVSGIEVFIGDERIGSMINITIPDEKDEESMTSFVCEVETWLIENT